jgi:putative DNA methylase
MIPKECKRLAEVDFLIAVVPKHAAREKPTRHGNLLDPLICFVSHE